MQKWAFYNNVILDFSRLRKPTDNPFIELFKGSFRVEFLNVNWLLSLYDAKEKIAQWKKDYSEFRCYGSLDDQKPNQVHENMKNMLEFSILACIA